MTTQPDLAAARSLPPRGPDGRFRRPEVQDLSDPSLYLNRELSWLEFNRRVLAQAADTAVPLLERLRFISIFHSNLDEFFMIRVAGLKDQVAAGLRLRTPDGMSAVEQLEAISRRVRPMAEQSTVTLHERILPLLARRGVGVVHVADLDERTLGRLHKQFDEQIFPVLTPLAVDPGHPFPYISNLAISLAVSVRDHKTGQRKLARVKVPGVLPRFWQVPGSRRAWVPLEELIRWRLDALFPGMDVESAHLFRVTRNADMDVDEDEAEDLLLAIQAQLSRRRFGSVVRLEVADDMPADTVRTLQEELDISSMHTYPVRGLLGLADVSQLADLDQPTLRFSPWVPVTHPRLRTSADDPVDSPTMFERIAEHDILLRHPYHSFATSVEQFVTAAADDPQVLAIKQTLYRTSGDSPMFRALIHAAEAGKQVVALVELKARFDEEANIEWARILERAGVHVVYGLVGLKTHCKTMLVVRRETEGIRRYVHIGTGNYHPGTAKLYTDLGLLTADVDIAEDVTQLFNYLTGYARHDRYRQLMVAPVSLRDRITELIREQAELGTDGLIRVKLNSLSDRSLIRELYAASRAGATVDLIVRGICGIRPGIPGVSDRIRVMSVLGRLLEHERILQFGQDMWIGSADWLPRNLDRRVEAMVPIEDEDLAKELRRILDVTWQDTRQGWRLRADGTWETPPDVDSVASQARFMAETRAADLEQA
ncbi:Polyphosphate kinase [Euzebya pacifica]|uniref:Polyphosphate kinase n=1 Tax=Euzebya pacifica TaxID=1608957 RepID=A0A346XYB2_9ACTN|nr:polyphosphate kinase 1 [Euzebya pacifica]AXV07209.1 Polyphosphate kinase [Euzebya pacifica]